MLDNLRKQYNRLFKPAQPLPSGIYHYQAPPDAPLPYRLHLRVDPNNEGILVVNASTVLHMNATACEYAYHLIKGSSEKEIIQDISSRYQIDKHQVTKDFKIFEERIRSLIESPDLDPVTFLDFDRDEIYSANLSAPLRLDCALTYQTVEDKPGENTPVERVDHELVTAEWIRILDKAWEVGIPQAVFTGGEPTLRPDLVDLVQHTEDLGMVVGILSDGLRFTDNEFRHRILAAGLDHLMLVLDPDNDHSWEALRDTLAEDLFITVHLTITPENQADIRGLIYKLADMGVKSISLSESDPSLTATLNQARDLAAFLQVSLVWDLPVPYSQANPVSLEYEKIEDIPQGAGKAWLYVEPDGDVLPTQGVTTVLGNMLTGSWDAIWQKAQETAA